jgi:hypothetical protein
MPVLSPVVVGVKETLMVHVALGTKGEEETQLSDSEKSPVVRTPRMPIGPFPPLVNVDCCGALLVPTLWLPKFKEVGNGLKARAGTVTGILTLTLEEP